jgi:hypothetical protein
MEAGHGSHPLGAHGWLGLLAAAVLLIVFILTLEVSSATAASPKACRVTNATTELVYGRLQQAVNAAKPGARLTVRGVCQGGTFIDRDVTIQGSKTRSSGKPILDGGHRARVIVIKPGVRVGLRDLSIIGGKAHLDRPGGGISNKGRLTLRDVVLHDNDSFVGNTAGIHNDGIIRMFGSSVVKEKLGLASGAQCWSPRPP